MPYSRRFGEEVAQAIGENSQRDIANKMGGVSPTTVSNMVAGRIPTDAILVRFAEAIGQDPEAWKRRARLYSEETHLRSLGFLPDDAVKQIVSIMEEAEREQEKKNRSY